MFFYIDIYYIILIIPVLIFALIAQGMVSSNYKKYSAVGNRRGLTGAQAAAELLRLNGVNNVRIERVSGKLSDHYDPKANVIRLSEGVYDSTSIAAVGIACHEAGHACQYAENYFPIKIRMSVIPLANIGSTLGLLLAVIGLIFQESLGTFGNTIFLIGIFLYAFVALFQFVTLPVEFNASKRAMQTINSHGLLTAEEAVGARKVLTAAALTYVAALLSALANLLRLILLSNNRRRR